MKIVCLTSNLYHPVLVPFAHYWNKFAGADRRVTVACYDAPLPELPDNFDALRIGAQANFDWSLGLDEALRHIDDPIILLMLEDYFLSETVNWHWIEYAELLMRDDRSIAKFDLTDDRLKVAHEYRSLFTGGVSIIQSAHDALFQTSLQAALWRTSTLSALLCEGENPWQFEKRGTKRWITERACGYLGGDILGFDPPPMRYANAVGGEGNHPGVISGKHMPQWMRDECRVKGWLT